MRRQPSTIARRPEIPAAGYPFRSCTAMTGLSDLQSSHARTLHSPNCMLSGEKISVLSAFRTVAGSDGTRSTDSRTRQTGFIAVNTRSPSLQRATTRPCRARCLTLPSAVWFRADRPAPGSCSPAARTAKETTSLRHPVSVQPVGHGDEAWLKSGDCRGRSGVSFPEDSLRRRCTWFRSRPRSRAVALRRSPTAGVLLGKGRGSDYAQIGESGRADRRGGTQR
jgi:hypothetical protein